MADKATVTNVSVSEPDNKTTVTNGSVSESERAKILEEGRRQAKAEFDRESKTLSERLTESQNRIAELEEKANLSAAQEKELRALKAKEGDIEAKLEQTREKTREETNHDTSVTLMNQFIRREAKTAGVKFEDLHEELNKICRQYGWLDKSPLERAELAFEVRAERKENETIREENKRLKAEKDAFSENGQHTAKKRTAEETRDAHVNGDFQAGVQRGADLDARQAALDAENKKR